MMIRSLIFVWSFALSAPAAAQHSPATETDSVFSDEQKDTLCYSFADLGVAAIEAREAGVPINKILEYFREIPADIVPNESIRTYLQEALREGIVKTYAEPSLGRRPTPQERQQLINRFTAECILDFENDEDSE